jgi:hypothetical protein
MRLYSWVVMYLEGIHAGIQTAHLQGEIHSKYHGLVQNDIKYQTQDNGFIPIGSAFKSTTHSKCLDIYNEWEQDHKVIQVYNGGYSSSLRQRHDQLRKYGDMFGLPYAQWHESQDALDGALTAVGIIVPEKYYNSWMVKKPNYTAIATNGLGQALRAPKTDEEDFFDFLHNCKHAR